MLNNLISANYYMGITPNGDICEEFITFGNPANPPSLLTGAQMTKGQCNQWIFGNPVKTEQNASGYYQFFVKQNHSAPVVQTPVQPVAPTPATAPAPSALNGTIPGTMTYTAVSPGGQMCQNFTVIGAVTDPKMA